MQDRFKTLIAVNTLKLGGVIAYPTEAVYGLGCDPDNETALLRLLQLKHRAANLGLILIGGCEEHLRPYFEHPGDSIMAKVRASWPGPSTWLLPASNAHPLVTGYRQTIAVRVTDHPVGKRLCDAFGGAIVSTSANRSGIPPALSALQVRKQFGNTLDAIVAGNLGDSLRPTTITDATSGTVLRTG